MAPATNYIGTREQRTHGSFGKSSGLSGKQVVFPQTSNKAHVVLKASPKQPLTAFTVCLKHYTDLTRAYSLFSYATRNSHNDIIIYKYKPNQYTFYVGGEAVTFLTPEKQSLERETLCASWDSATGLARLWVNGKRLPPRSLKKGYSISADSSIVLGQDQDTQGGRFHGFQADSSIVLGQDQDTQGGAFQVDASIGLGQDEDPHGGGFQVDTSIGLGQDEDILGGGFDGFQADSSIVVGQDQDTQGGGFDINDSYVGELLDVRMWERVLSQEEMKRALLDDNIPGNAMIDWETVNYEAKGGVIIERAWSP